MESDERDVAEMEEFYQGFETNVNKFNFVNELIMDEVRLMKE